MKSLIKWAWDWAIRICVVILCICATALCCVLVEPGGPGVKLVWYLAGMGVYFWTMVLLFVFLMAQLVLQVEKNRGPLFYLAMGIAALDAWVCVLIPWIKDGLYELWDRGRAEQAKRFELIRAQSQE